MMTHARWIAAGLAVAALSVVAFFAGFLVFRGKTSTSSFESVDVSLLPAFEHGYAPTSLYDDAYAKAGGVERVDARSALVAHHLLVASEIAKTFETVGSEDTETVVVLSPNHFSRGVSPMQITDGAWSTPYGTLETDQSAVAVLLDALTRLNREPKTFVREHGINAVTPFVRRSFPNARLVPIVLDESLPPEDAEALGRAIASLLPGATVIASVDISHNLPAYAQEFHDEITRDTLAHDGDPVALEVDSNATLRTLQAFNVSIGASVWHETYHGNSIGLLGSGTWEENTSHSLGYFEAGRREASGLAAVHLVRADLETEDEALARFLSGTHALVRADDPPALVEKNGRSIAFVRESGPQETFLSEVSAAAGAGRFVVALPRETSGSEAAAQAGAGLIVDAQATSPSGITQVDGVPIVPLFRDQGGDAMTLGMLLAPDSVTLTLLPVHTRDGRTTPMSDADARALFARVAALSPPSWRSDLERGTLTIPYDY